MQGIAAARIVPLQQCRHLAAEIAAHLHLLWQEFPPWADRAAIEQRLLRSLGPAALPHTLVALLEDGQFAGTASVKLRELDHHPDKEHWLGEVFVRGDLRHRGLGTLLVESAARYAFEHGVEALYLYTPDQQKLYASLGWVGCWEGLVDQQNVSIMVRYRN